MIQNLGVSLCYTCLMVSSHCLHGRCPTARFTNWFGWTDNPTKSSGPDGLQALFHQRCWDIVGKSTLAFILRWQIWSGVCESFICLIPKVNSQSLISQYRPIALCNVMYKFITKCMTLRLRNSMPNLVFHCQSSFIKGRSTQDNIFMIQEILHSIHTKNKNKLGAWWWNLILRKPMTRLVGIFLKKLSKHLISHVSWSGL